MSDIPTPRTDKLVEQWDYSPIPKVMEAHARTLERELAAANERIRRLEEALEFGVGPMRAKELLAENHIGEVTEMVEETKEVPCPDCYGGHFKPCNICGDSGVALLRTQAKEAKP